jgi:hypothetical protein
VTACLHEVWLGLILIVSYNNVLALTNLVIAMESWRWQLREVRDVDGAKLSEAFDAVVKRLVADDDVGRQPCRKSLGGKIRCQSRVRPGTNFVIVKRSWQKKFTKNWRFCSKYVPLAYLMISKVLRFFVEVQIVER